MTKVAAHLQTVFIRNDGSLWGMGANGADNNADGSLGDGTTTNRKSPIKIVDEQRNGRLGLGSYALSENQWVRSGAWGGMSHGQLGIDSTANQMTPIEIVSGGVSKIAAGLYHSAFVKTDASLWAMGRNVEGQLGTGDFTSSLVPMQVIASGVADVSCGSQYTLVRMTDGSLKTFGKDEQDAELGLGRSLYRLTPYRLSQKLLVP